MKSGHITIATADTYTAGPNVQGRYWFIIPHPDNTSDNVFVRPIGSALGFPLNKTLGIPTEATNLNKLEFSVGTNGDKVCYIAAPL